MTAAAEQDAAELPPAVRELVILFANSTHALGLFPPTDQDLDAELGRILALPVRDRVAEVYRLAREADKHLQASWVVRDFPSAAARAAAHHAAVQPAAEHRLLAALLAVEAEDGTGTEVTG